MIEYEDFSLKIEPKRGEVYPVIVLRSPAGEGRSSFQLPFDPDKIGDILFDLGRTVRGGGQVPLRDVSPAATRTRPQRIGDQLFNALFSGPVRSLLDRSLGMIHGRQRGLRIKLHIDPEDPSLAQLASLPWEFLYRKETRDFLNLSRFTPILRYLDIQRPYTPLPLEPPLRILVVISDPAGYIPLELDRERAQIEASWAQQKGVEVEFMEQATILALQDRLADQPYHVLHYMGHGDFDERTGQGVLVMEDEDGRGAMVDGSTLGVLLRDLPTMRLVFLNACETARVTKEKGLDPFAGVAAAMVMAGIPAVVAMQFPISDSAAITFSQKFYPLLARGDPVDAAVAEGRRAIRLAEARTMEWGTPVLFMRAPQGVIFQVSEAQREKAPLPQIPELPEEVDEALEQRLTELYTRGLSAFWLEEWEKAARSFQAIVDVRSDYEDAADKLAEAKRQAKLHALYAQAQTAQEAGDWPGALAALEELAAEAADFKDTAERLQVVRKQKQLADLYAEAQHLHQAQQWQAVVNVFGQIQDIEPDYADPLLPTAEREVAEQKRQAKLNNLYSRAVRGMDAGRWQEVRQLLAQVQEMEPSFRETERLLARVEAKIAREEAERQRQEQITALYEQALGLARGQQWQQALAAMEEIQTLDPQFADPEGITARAQEETERQRRLNALYAQAQAAQEAEDWSGALSALEELVAEAADFRDAADLLETVKKQKRLADLYDEARQFHQAQQWQAVVNVFAQIAAIEPDYPDPEGLLSAAKREDAEWKRQAELNDLYSRAVREMDAGRWPEARQLLAQVQEMEPGFHETERLLARVEAEIEREETKRQRQEQTATLYEQALGLARARQWRQVQAKMEEIQTLDPEFADPEGIAARAREEVTREEEEARRQSELAALYAEAVRLLKAGQYQEALEKWGEVRARDPRYPDRQKVQAKARKKLEALAKGAPPKRGLPRWAVVAIGGFALVAVVAVVVLRGRVPGGGAREATPTSVPVVATVAATPTNTPRPPTPTDTPPPPTPTRTRIPTNTPRPATPTPTIALPSPVSDVLSDAKVLYHNDFDELPSAGWDYNSRYVKSSSGMVEITGASGWNAYVYGPGPNDGEGVLLLFKYDADAEFVLYLKTGEYGTPSRRAWYIGDDFVPGSRQGTSDDEMGEFIGNLSSNPDTWYYLLFSVGQEGELLMQVWPRDNPSQRGEYRRTFGEDWAGLDWGFGIDANHSKVYFDSYTEVSFSEVLGSGASARDPWGEVVVPPGGTLNVAFVGALSGDWSSFGEVQKTGFLMAIEDVAAVKGFPIEAVIADGGCDENTGKQAANTVVSNENIVGVVGHNCSGSCREGALVYEEAHLVMISPSCSLPDLTESGFEVFNRVATRDDWGGDERNSQVVNTSTYQEFANRYEDRYGQPIEGDLAFYAAYAYDATGILIQSIEQVAEVDASGNLVIGRQALARAVRATSGYQGVTGVISLDDKGDRLPSTMPCQSSTSEIAEIESPWLRNKVTSDGKMTNAEEWTDAICLDLALVKEKVGPATVNSRWWIKNDTKWLYLLARVPVAEVEASGVYIGYYWPYPYEGLWDQSDLGWVDQDGNTWDGYGWDEEKFYDDTLASPPGENNVEGTASKSATYYWFEFRKALNSGDGNDWSWSPGETVGTGQTGALLLGISDSNVPTIFEIRILLRLGSP